MIARVSATSVVRLAFLAAFSMTSCATAAGEVSGGDPRLDSAAPDSGIAVGVDADMADTAPVTWSELYRDYFGPQGGASCAGTGSACHATMTSVGYKGSDFLCPPDDSTGCYDSMTDPANALLVATPFDNTYLYLVLRKKSGPKATDSMPLTPTNFYFETSDLEKIQSWFDAGKRND